MCVGVEEVLIGLVVLVISYLVSQIWKNRSLPPGPCGLPVLGYLPFLDPKCPHLTLTELAKKYGPIYSMQMGKILAVVISDPKMLRNALNKEELSGRADLYVAHGIMKGYGIIGTEGTVWKEQRKFAVSCLKNLGMTKFGPKRDKLESLILSGVDNLIEELNASDLDDEPVDMEHAINQHLGNVINLLLFGRTWKEDDDVWKRLLHCSDEGLKKMADAGVLNFLPALRFLPKYKSLMGFILNGLDFTHSMYQMIVDEHTGEEDDVIAYYLKEMKQRGKDNLGSFSEKQLMFLLGDLFGAGLDTSAITLRWLFICIACHSDIQAKLHEELDFICGDNTPKLEDSPQLPYLDAVISETLRFRPVVPMGVPHGATRSCTLENYFIPQGSMVIPLQWAVHMNSDHWEEPHLFKPDRFLDKEGHILKPEAFMPFQVGKRICLGEELGKAVIYLFASNVLKKFKVELALEKYSPIDPLEADFKMLLKPKISHFRFKRRNTTVE